MSYAGIQDRAADIIAAKGQAVTINRHAEGAYNVADSSAAITTTTTSTKGVVLPLSRGFTHREHTNIEIGDRQLLLPGDIDEPEAGDTVTIASVDYTIVEVSPLNPGGTKLIYDCIIRGAA